MGFPQTVIEQAFIRSGGRCECTRQHTGQFATHHGGRCPTQFTYAGHAWEAHHVTAQSVGGADTLSNCQILCLTCHRLTDSYGRS